jgi:IclR family pca regulon transcriptional regulator
MSKPQKQHFYGTLEKGLNILSLFDQNHTNLSLKEISQLTGINKSTAYNLVNTFVEMGYLNKEEHTKRIKVGPNAIILSHNLTSSHYIFKIVQKFISYTATAHNLSVYSVILENRTIISQYAGEIFDYFDIISAPLKELCYCTALGKALLAYLPEGEVKDLVSGLDYVKRTGNTIMNEDDLLADLKKTRSRGYSVNNEEYKEDIVSIAAPFFNLKEKKPAGAVCFDFSTNQYSLEKAEREYVNILLQLARDISSAIPT